MPLGMEVGLSPGVFVLDGDPATLPKKGAEPPPFPIFGPFLLWPNGWMNEDASWYGGRFQPRGICVRWVPRSPRQKGRRSPTLQFLAHVYCGQTAGWIKMALGMEVGLSPSHVVLDGDPALLPENRGQSPPIFGIFIVAKRLDASRCHFVWM